MSDRKHRADFEPVTVPHPHARFVHDHDSGTHSEPDNDDEEWTAAAEAVENDVLKPIDDPREQERLDRDIERAVEYFFSNQFEEAEQVMVKRAHCDPLFALGYAGVYVLKAVMTFNESDMSSAAAKLDQAEALATAQLGYYFRPSALSSAISGIAGLIGSTLRFGRASSSSKDETAGPPLMPNGEMRAILVRGEANLFQAMLLLLQESLFAFMKAGLKFRKGYLSYTKTYEEMMRYRNIGDLDRHTVGGIKFGWGTMNSFMSMLPGTALKALTVVGVQTDKAKGLQALRESFENRNIRSLFASFNLLAIHGILPSFSPTILAPVSIPLAEDIVNESLSRHPKSGLHLFLSGRVHRLKRDLKASNEAFEKSVEVQVQWKELKSLCWYELGLNAMFELDWRKAQTHMETLSTENYWSKAFYTYAVAVCHTHLSNLTEASRLYGEAPALINRKVGGRTIGVEQYVARKTAIFASDAWNGDRTILLLPGLEMLFIWHGFAFMSVDKLKESKREVESALKVLERESGIDLSSIWTDTDTVDATMDDPPPPPSTPIPLHEYTDRLAPLILIYASILRELNLLNASIKSLDWVFERDRDIKQEKFVIPFAHYELGLVYWMRGDREGCARSMARAKEFKGYNFEFRLELRIHLSLMRIEELLKEEEAAAVQ
ncbi:Tetratricopeptide repeat protein 39B [Borealophlyctis nickersoniae]|nr:Tetratricopeptide repeat protein 39B [Borealophlyctis nickersoniae]